MEYSNIYNFVCRGQDADSADKSQPASYVCLCHLRQGLLGLHTGLKKLDETTFEVAFSFQKNIIEPSRILGKKVLNVLHENMAADLRWFGSLLRSRLVIPILIFGGAPTQACKKRWLCTGSSVNSFSGLKMAHQKTISLHCTLQSSCLPLRHTFFSRTKLTLLIKLKYLLRFKK